MIALTNQDTIVKVKNACIYRFLSFTAALKVQIMYSTNKVLWSGGSASIASFKVDKPTKIKIVPNGTLHHPTEGTIKPGKRYQVINDIYRFVFFKIKN